MTKEERIHGVIRFFKLHQAEARIELDYDTPFQLLVAVILSAQCTDKRVNLVTPSLFDAFPTPEIMAKANIEEVFFYIKSVSYPNSKAKYLVTMSQMLVEKFNSRVPECEKEMQTLPGVGRKTAHVVAFNIYKKPTIAVDTHVFRVSKRMGLVDANSSTPLSVEKQLSLYVPEENRGMVNQWLVLHGRYVCVARNPKCKLCKISEYCKYYADNNRRLIE
jgi:endonuclease-3